MSATDPTPKGRASGIDTASMTATLTATTGAPADYCPKCCDTPELRRLHGRTAGIGTRSGGGWYCTRCRYEAVDLEDATTWAVPLSKNPGRLWERLAADAREGRPVDPLMIARAMGAYLADLDDPDGTFGTICEVVYALGWPGHPFDIASPWRNEPADTVARMVLAVLNAAGVAVVDVSDGPPRMAELLEVLARLVDTIRTDNPSDADGARLIVAELLGGGWGLVDVR